MRVFKNILVIDFGGIGDLVLSIPFLRGLKDSFPLCKVSVLCAQRAGGILKEQPYVDNLYCTQMMPLNIMQIALKLRKMKFDLAVNLMPETSFFASVKMYLLFALINAGLWAGRDTEGRGFFYGIRVHEENMQVENEVLLYGRILKAIGGESFDERLEFHILQTNRDKAIELLSRERKFPERPFILVNPGSDWPAKRWPIERYAELLNKLRDVFPYIEFGIIGTKDETTLADFLRERVGESVCILSGKTPIEILPAILEKAALLITNDSGPSHITRAVGIPTVILVGPSQPAYFTIKGEAESLVIYHHISCAPCLKVSCDKMDCWKMISVEEVFEITSKVLKRISYEPIS